jgi:polyisoprenoid-binding protein YceI
MTQLKEICMPKLTVAAVALAAGLIALPVWAADTYSIDPRHTFPTYEISHFGWSTQRGRFDKTSGKIVLDRAAKSGTVEVTIDTASIDTGVEKLNEHLSSEDFFNVAKHPTITFKASKIVFSGDSPSSVPGEITILGVTKPATLTVTRFSCGMHPMLKKEVCGADATATIKRSEFGMTKYLPALGDDVKLLLNVESIKE